MFGGEKLLGDMNGDGFLDLVVGGSDIAVLFNDGTGHFPRVSRSTTSDAMWIEKLSLCPLDNDGDLDVVASFWGKSLVAVLFNDSQGHLSVSSTFGDAINWVSSSFVGGDLDLDGDMDIILSQYVLTPTNQILLNDGTGFFATDPMNPGFGGVGSDWPNEIRLGDLDGDNDLDAMIFACDPVYYTYSALWVNDGESHFSSIPSVFDCENDLDKPTYDFLLGDLDADGDLDVLWLSFEIEIFFNQE